MLQHVQQLRLHHLIGDDHLLSTARQASVRQAGGCVAEQANARTAQLNSSLICASAQVSAASSMRHLLQQAQLTPCASGSLGC